MDKPLDGKVAVITGGMRGIGRGIALGLARAGARVVIDDIFSEGAEDLVCEIAELGSSAVFVDADVTDPAQHARIIDRALRTFGQIDVLVNNAGRNVREDFLNVSRTRWEEIVGLNLVAPYFLSQAVAREMIKGRCGGKIINIASVHDSVGALGCSVYAISKAGLQMLTKSLALELAPHNINVNSISPGTVVVERNRSLLLERSPFSEAQMARIPMARFADPTDIAGVAVFLASAAAAYITGHSLYVDGGILLQ
jgi:NAD(P)-dependent dehydrogenase (short-subunit alcohol dehydrogenase family)